MMGAPLFALAVFLPSVFSATTYDFCGTTGINLLYPGATSLLSSFSGQYTISNSNGNGPYGTAQYKYTEWSSSGAVTKNPGVASFDLVSYPNGPTLSRSYYQGSKVVFVEIECIYNVVYSSSTNELLVYTGVPNVDGMLEWQNVYCISLATGNYIKNYANSAYYQFGNTTVPSFSKSDSYTTAYGFGYSSSLAASSAYIKSAYAYNNAVFATNPNAPTTYYVPLSETGTLTKLSDDSSTGQCTSATISAVNDPAAIGTAVSTARSGTTPELRGYLQPYFLAQTSSLRDKIEQYCIYSATYSTTSTGTSGTIYFLNGMAQDLASSGVYIASTGLSAAQASYFGCTLCENTFTLPVCFKYTSTPSTGLFSYWLNNGLACGSTETQVTMVLTDSTAANQTVVTSSTAFTSSVTTTSTSTLSVSLTSTRRVLESVSSAATLATPCNVWALRKGIAAGLGVSTNYVVINSVAIGSNTLYFGQDSMQNKNKASPSGCSARLLSDAHETGSHEIGSRELATLAASVSATILNSSSSLSSTDITSAVSSAIASTTGATATTTAGTKTVATRVLSVPATTNPYASTVIVSSVSISGLDSTYVSSANIAAFTSKLNSYFAVYVAANFTAYGSSIIVSSIINSTTSLYSSRRLATTSVTISIKSTGISTSSFSSKSQALVTTSLKSTTAALKSSFGITSTYAASVGTPTIIYDTSATTTTATAAATSSANNDLLGLIALVALVPIAALIWFRFFRHAPSKSADAAPAAELSIKAVAV